MKRLCVLESSIDLTSLAPIQPYRLSQFTLMANDDGAAIDVKGFRAGRFRLAGLTGFDYVLCLDRAIFRDMTSHDGNLDGETGWSEIDGKRVPTALFTSSASLAYKNDTAVSAFKKCGLIISKLKRTRDDIWADERRVDVRLKYEDVTSELESFLEDADLSGVPLDVAFDLENLPPAHITEVGLAFEREGRTLSLSLKLADSMGDIITEDDEMAFWRLVDRTLNHPNVNVVFHNGMHDLAVLKLGVGIVCSRYQFDTMLAVQVAYPGFELGLESLAMLFLDISPWKTDRSPLYNAKDAAYTLKLKALLHDTVLARGLYPSLMSDIRQTLVAVDAQLEGVLIDKNKLKEAISSLKREIAEKEDEIAAMLTKLLPETFTEEIRPSDARQMARLMEGAGLKLPRSRKTGRVSLAEKVLRRLKKPQAILSKLTELKGLSRRMSLYKSVTLSPSGRVHPAYRINYTPLNGPETFGEWSVARSIILPYGPDACSLDEFGYISDMVIAGPGRKLCAFRLASEAFLHYLSVTYGGSWRTEGVPDAARKSGYLDDMTGRRRWFSRFSKTSTLCDYIERSSVSSLVNMWICDIAEDRDLGVRFSYPFRGGFCLAFNDNDLGEEAIMKIRDRLAGAFCESVP